VRADAETEREVWNAVDALFEHFAECRPDSALACFASDPDVSLSGSEVSEVFIGPAALREFLTKLLARPSGPKFRLFEKRMTRRGDVAWFTADAEVTIGDVRISPYRLTGVLEKRNGRWFWMLFNGSEPLPDRV
jgi:hypothetical protein